jgi:hypothetical protein
MELDGTISFLDLKILKCSNSFKFDIYRKPTNTCSYIHFFSDHSVAVKTSVFSSMFLRGLRLVDPEFLDLEFNRIFEIGSKLCYPFEFLNDCLVKAKKSFYNVEVRAPFECKNLLKLPFHSDFDRLPRLLRKLDIKVVFNFKNTIKNALIKNSPKDILGSIYSIPCGACDLVYIGQTGKSLDERVRQHKIDCSNLLLSNSMFSHIYHHNHAIDWRHASNVMYNRDYIERNLLEGVCINSCERLNLRPGMFSLDGVISDMIRSQYPNLLFSG